MSLESQMRTSWFKEEFIIAVLLLGFSYCSAFGQTSPGYINFTKKEIAFFKWGNGQNEVSLEKLIKTKGTTQVENNETLYWPMDMKIDGNDNIYFPNGNGRIFILSSDSNSFKKIIMKKTGGIISVDENGCIYGVYSKDGPPYGFIRTEPDGTQEIFKNFDLGHVENGIAYPRGNKKTNRESPVTIYDSENNPEKLPPLLFSRSTPNIRNADFKEDIVASTFLINTKKINRHLKKINKKIISDNIKIKVEKKNEITPLVTFLGVDDNEQFYFLSGYPSGPEIDDRWIETYITVFSQDGKKLTEIKIDPDYFNKQVVRGELALDIRGNIFQMLASEDGIHFLKWVKN
jgi:hypothetical protein